MNAWAFRVALAVLLAAAGLLTIDAAPATALAPPPGFVTAWGSNGTGAGQFDLPEGLEVNTTTGQVYVTDTVNHRVQRFGSNGSYQLQWGGHGTGDGEFEHPSAVAVNPTSGDVYVADAGLHRVQRFSSAGVYLSQWGSEGDGDGELDGPLGIAADPASGDVYVSDDGNDRVQRFSATGTYLGQWGSSGSGNGQFVQAWGVAVDPTTGEVLVADQFESRIQRFTPAGGFLDSWGTFGYGDGEFVSPRDLGVDPVTGAVYVVDGYWPRVQAFTPDGLPITAWGTRAFNPSGNGGSGPGQFYQPHGIGIDAAGDVYVADWGNDRVQKFGYRSRPDARIQSGAAGPLRGNNIYNTLVGQSVTDSARPRRSVTFRASIQNDAVFAERVRLRGEGSTKRFTVVYRNPAGRVVTESVTTGGYTTPLLSPQATHVLTVTVTVRATAPRGAVLARRLTARSTTDPTRTDTVRFTTRRS